MHCSSTWAISITSLYLQPYFQAEKESEAPHLPAGFSPERVSQRAYIASYMCVRLFCHSLLFYIIFIRMHALITMKSINIKV